MFRSAAHGVLAATLVLLATVARGQTGAPILALAKAGSGGASDDYLSISLDNGSGRLIDRLERNPLELRSRSLAENLFQVIGRTQPARAGEIFFAPITSSDGSVRAALYVETPIGYAAYFDQPGRGARLGDVVTLTTRPFEDIAAADGNFVLLMRHDGTGRTEGTYLYHATSGKGIYLDGLRKLETSPSASSTSALPSLAGPVTAAEIYAGSEATASYVVLDSASGEIHFFDLSPNAPRQVSPQKSDVGLYDVFARQGSFASSRRFVAVTVNASLSLTEHVFIADAVTGETAVLEYVIDANNPTRLRKAASLGRWFSSDGVGERVFSAVPRVTTSGATVGLWLIDSQTRRTVYVDRPGLAAEMTVTPITIQRR